MEYRLTIGGIRFRITCDFDVVFEEPYRAFLTPDDPVWDVDILFTKDFSKAPRLEGVLLGEDLLLEYYHSENGVLCAAKGGRNGYLSISASNLAFSKIVCYTNITAFPKIGTISHLFRMIPMRKLLQRFGVLFFHASQVSIDGMGILFTAPSGTGKTTQARLWQAFRGAKIVCNDRTLVRDGLTYGYPFDGSEPVNCNDVNKIAAIVSLSQHKNNYVQQRTGAAALAGLMPQMVIDTWDPEARFCATEQLMLLMKTCPVYHLGCTPDSAAVDCLWQRLITDGVMK